MSVLYRKGNPGHIYFYQNRDSKDFTQRQHVWGIVGTNDSDKVTADHNVIMLIIMSSSHLLLCPDSLTCCADYVHFAVMEEITEERDYHQICHFYHASTKWLALFVSIIITYNDLTKTF